MSAPALMPAGRDARRRAGAEPRRQAAGSAATAARYGLAEEAEAEVEATAASSAGSTRRSGSLLFAPVAASPLPLTATPSAPLRATSLSGPTSLWKAVTASPSNGMSPWWLMCSYISRRLRWLACRVTAHAPVSGPASAAPQCVSLGRRIARSRPGASDVGHSNPSVSSRPA